MIAKRKSTWRTAAQRDPIGTTARGRVAGSQSMTQSIGPAGRPDPSRTPGPHVTAVDAPVGTACAAYGSGAMNGNEYSTGSAIPLGDDVSATDGIGPPTSLRRPGLARRAIVPAAGDTAIGNRGLRPIFREPWNKRFQRSRAGEAAPPAPAALSALIRSLSLESSLKSGDGGFGGSPPGGVDQSGRTVPPS